MKHLLFLAAHAFCLCAFATNDPQTTPKSGISSQMDPVVPKSRYVVIKEPLINYDREIARLQHELDSLQLTKFPNPGQVEKLTGTIQRLKVRKQNSTVQLKQLQTK